MLFWFKACPRCKGDLFLEKDEYGPEWTCLQCGYRRDIMKSTKVLPGAHPVKAHKRKYKKGPAWYARHLEEARLV